MLTSIVKHAWLVIAVFAALCCLVPVWDRIRTGQWASRAAFRLWFILGAIIIFTLHQWLNR